MEIVIKQQENVVVVKLDMLSVQLQKLVIYVVLVFILQEEHHYVLFVQQEHIKIYMVNHHVLIVPMVNIQHQLELLLAQLVQLDVMEIVLNQQENVIVVKQVMDIQVEIVQNVQQVVMLQLKEQCDPKGNQS